MILYSGCFKESVFFRGVGSDSVRDRGLIFLTTKFLIFRRENKNLKLLEEKNKTGKSEKEGLGEPVNILKSREFGGGPCAVNGMKGHNCAF